MTVKELIVLLLEHPMDLHVKMNSENGHDHVEHVESRDAYYDHDAERYVVLYNHKESTR